jgi:hypothetical protein
MLVVAVVGLAMSGGVWGYRMWRLSRDYDGLAESYKRRVIVSRDDGRLFRGNSTANDDYAAAWMARCSAKAADYAALVRQYELAARYPWLPVDPDPPEPERVPSGVSIG